MTKRTIIYLHSIELSQASFVVCEDEEVEKSMLRAHLSDLTEADKQHEITVVVPALDVLLTQASLPKLNHSRLMQALPFALEEQLIDDVGTLHFSVADYQPDGTLPVAIVARKKMDEWIALLKQYHIVPTYLYSAVFLLPYVEKNWSVSILQEGATVRQNTFQGFSGEASNFSLLMELAIQSAPEKPECIHIYSTFETPVDIKTNDVVINEIHLPEEAWLETLPAWINPLLSINLLQGAYQPKHKASETKKIWLYASYAALAWVGIAFFSQLLSFFILHHQSSKIEERISAIYKKNFPAASSVIQPRERMETKLASLEEQTNKNYFLVLLAKVGSQLSQHPNIQLNTIDYREDQLTLALTANKFDDIDILARTLSGQGLKVKEQNAATSGNAVKANLLIQRGTA